jgi:hypothetical protein
MDAIDEVLKRMEQQKEEPALPEEVMALPLLQMAYRGQVKLTPQQARCAIEALPYENPKVSAVAISHMNSEDFATALDRCIERSGKKPLPLPPPKVINATVEPLPAEKLKGPFAQYKNNYRRR